MKNIVFIYLILNSSIYCSSQIPGFFVAKEWSKEIALFQSKAHLCKHILGIDPSVVKFEVLPLAAASSGDLTSLWYNCTSKKMEGLLLAFYGNYWNDQGVLYQGFAFRNFVKSEAIEFLNLIQKNIDDNITYLREDPDNTNIYFSYKDMDVMVWSSSYHLFKIRLFWNGFDSTWEKLSFERSKQRFEKSIK